MPGEDLDFVQYQLDDPDAYEGETIIVVGAGDDCAPAAAGVTPVTTATHPVCRLIQYWYCSAFTPSMFCCQSDTIGVGGVAGALSIWSEASELASMSTTGSLAYSTCEQSTRMTVPAAMVLDSMTG